MANKPKNKFSRNMLITTSGILIAVLTVWAQLWTVTAQLYNDTTNVTSVNVSLTNMTSISYGLCYIYWSILALLIAIIITIAKGSVVRFSLALFGFSLLGTIVEVMMSLIPVIAKTSTNTYLWESLFKINLPFWVDIALMVITPIALLLIWTAIAYWIKPTSKWFKELC